MSSSHCHSSPSSFSLSVCPFSVVLFLATAAATTLSLRRVQRSDAATERSDGASSSQSDASRSASLPPCTVVFVLGAPGSGKGTQCQLVVDRLSGWSHLSAGDLLRAERSSTDASTSSALRETIQACMAAGKLVPSHVTCQLIELGMQRAYEERGTTKFLIDGFPRSLENLQAWNDSATASQHNVVFCLNLECPQEVLVGRLLERGKQGSGRVDDTPQVITKRFESHVQETAPIIQAYQHLGKLKTVASDRQVELVYQDVAACLKDL